MAKPTPMPMPMPKMVVVVNIPTMNNESTKQKAVEAAADVLGVVTIKADVKSHTVTVIGEMDAAMVIKKLQKVGKLDIVSVRPAAGPQM